VIFRQFDGLGLGIEVHVAVIPAWRAAGCFDLQIIQGLPQVKTPGRRGAPPAISQISFKFQTIGARFAWHRCEGFVTARGFACGHSLHQNKVGSKT
jgi:hypothetical protein